MKTKNIYCKLNEQQTEIEQFPVYVEHIESSGNPISDYTPVNFTQKVKPQDSRDSLYKLNLAIGAEEVVATWMPHDKTQPQIADWDVKDLERAKASKQAEIETAYYDAIDNGLEVNSIVYPIHDKAVEQLNVMLNQFTAEKQLGSYDGTQYKYMIDNDYNTQQVTKDNYITAIMEIINYREQLHFNKASKLDMIQNATSIEEVNNISF